LIPISAPEHYFLFKELSLYQTATRQAHGDLDKEGNQSRFA